MKKSAAVVIASAALLVVPASALATTGAGGAGLSFGDHHAGMAQSGELDGAMNPGMHDGFFGWTPM
jgi:hypothetical protein